MISIGSDHAGYEAKEKLKEHLKTFIPFKDFGTNSKSPCDYPLIAKIVAESVASGISEKGILICGSGIGMCIAANKIRGVRAAVCNEISIAKLARSHNDANILCLGARLISQEDINSIVETFLIVPFEGKRHQLRIDQIKQIESL